MRTSNARVRNVIISIYFILIVIAIILSTVFSAFKDVTGTPILTFFLFLFGFVALFFLVHWISKYFEYDSDGMKVVIINRGLLLSDYLNYREYKVEFEKHNLVSYKFRNFLIYRGLRLGIQNNNGKVKHVYFNVTLVSKKKRKYIRQSLRKMVRINRKKQIVNDGRE
ncbi:hypothetical protein E1J38_010965 [Seonamhaeicola sediminis]|uniref:DUF304 domain-containing protein n=1 Tax=Seonamhaeicola sediminis TaxID=2528206 RepID=A0A562YCX1_9FLAO|nr:hypothetical protein [Seonamhaeicola sediminis]TWO31899.1 hypothetical protein E1J38_010965 [Seonamhaeicola sediminis]